MEERFSKRGGQDPGTKWGQNRWMSPPWRPADQNYTQIIMTPSVCEKYPTGVKATCCKGRE